MFEIIVSLALLAGMIFAAIKALKWMFRTGQENNRQSDALTPRDLKILEESAARLTEDLRTVTDECVDRVERVCAMAEDRLRELENAMRRASEASRVQPHVQNDFPAVSSIHTEIPRLDMLAPEPETVFLEPGTRIADIAPSVSEAIEEQAVVIPEYSAEPRPILDVAAQVEMENPEPEQAEDDVYALINSDAPVSEIARKSGLTTGEIELLRSLRSSSR